MVGRRVTRAWLLLVAVLLLAATPGRVWADDLTSSELEEAFSSLLALDETVAGDVDRGLERAVSILPELASHPLFELALLRIRDLFPVANDPSWIEAPYRTLLAGQTLTPFNRSLLVEELARMLLRRGAYDELDASPVFDDRLTSFQLLGPLGFDGGALHPLAFGPEERIDLDERMAGRVGEVGWVPGRRLEGRSMVSPGRFLYPSGGCLYALGQVSATSGQEGPAVLLVEARGSVEVRVNGRVVVDAHRLERDLPPRFLVPFSLVEGWNRILVKISGDDQGLFSVGILDPRGEALLLREEEGRVLHDLKQGRPATLDPPAWEVTPWLRAHVESHPEDFRAHAALALLLRSIQLDSDALFHIEKACSLDGHPGLRAFLAETVLEAGHLPADHRKRTVTRICEEVLASHPDVVPLLVLRALDLHGDDRSEEAIAILRDRVLPLRSDHLHIHLFLARIYRSLGWEKEWREIMDRVWELWPGHPLIASDLVEVWRGRQRPDKALEIAEVSLAVDHGQNRLRRVRAQLLRDLGRVDEAVASLRVLLDREGDRFEVTEELAQLLEAAGKTDESLALRRELADRFPRYPLVQKRLADALYRTGSVREAVTILRGILEGAPGFHFARDLLLLLDTESLAEGGSLLEDEEVIFSLFREDVADLLRAAPPRSDWPSAGSIAVFDDVILRLYGDGSTRSETQQLFRIFDRRGIEKHGTEQVAGDVMDIRTIRPDGSVLEPIMLSGTGQFTMPGLTEGAFVHTRYFVRTAPIAGEPIRLPVFYFQDVDMDEPFARSRYVVIVPSSLDVQVRPLDFDGEKDEFVMGSARVHVFEKKNARAVENERFMPDPRTSFPRVAIDQPRTHLEVNALYRREVLERIRPTRELEGQVQAVTQGLLTDREKARALHAFVRSHVKNEAGSTEATAILVTREGSRFFLLAGLLRAAGIPFSYGRARVAPELDQDLEDEILGENFYVEPVVRIEPRDGGDPIYFGTDLDLPFGVLPTRLLGGPVFLVAGVSGSLETLPTLPPEDRVTQVNHVELVPGDGSRVYRVQLLTEIPSPEGFALKTAVLNMEDSRRRLVGMGALGARVTGAAFESVDFPGLEEESEPLRIRVVASLPEGSLESVEGGRALRPPLEALGLTEVFASGAERKHPIVFRQYDLRTDTAEIDPLPGLRVKSLPDDLVLESRLGRYAISFREEGGKILVVREIDFRPVTLAPGDYAALLVFCRSIDQKERERIVLEESGQ